MANVIAELAGFLMKCMRMALTGSGYRDTVLTYKVSNFDWNDDSARADRMPVIPNATGNDHVHVCFFEDQSDLDIAAFDQLSKCFSGF